MSDNFTCDMCKGTCPKAWSDDEAAKEASDVWGAATTEGMAVVCDDCWKKIRPRPTKKPSNKRRKTR